MLKKAKTPPALKKHQERMHITGAILLHAPVRGLHDSNFPIRPREASYYDRFRNTIGLVAPGFYPQDDYMSSVGAEKLSKGRTVSNGWGTRETGFTYAWADFQAKRAKFVSQPKFKEIKKKFGLHAWQTNAKKASGPGSRLPRSGPNDSKTGVSRTGRNGYALLMSKFSTPLSLLADPKEFYKSDLFEPGIGGNTGEEFAKPVDKESFPQDKDILSIKLRHKETGKVIRLHDLPEMHEFAYAAEAVPYHIRRFESAMDLNHQNSLRGTPTRQLSDPLDCSQCNLRLSPRQAVDFVHSKRDALVAKLSEYEPHPEKIEEWNDLHHILLNGEIDIDNKKSNLSIGNGARQGAGYTYEGHNLIGGGPEQLIVRGWNAPRINSTKVSSFSERYAAKIPVGYKGKGGFLCVHCIHHNDIIHNGFKPVTRGNPKDCIRCGEETNKKQAHNAPHLDWLVSRGFFTPWDEHVHVAPEDGIRTLPLPADLDALNRHLIHDHGQSQPVTKGVNFNKDVIRGDNEPTSMTALELAEFLHAGSHWVERREDYSIRHQHYPDTPEQTIDY